MVWGLKKQLAPALAEGRDTLAQARTALAVVVAVSLVTLVVALLTLDGVVELLRARGARC